MPDIKLKNGSGIEQTYTGVDTITVPLADGTGNWTFGLTDEELIFEASGNLYLFTPNTDKIFGKYVDRIKFKPTTYNNVTYYKFSRISDESTTEDLSPITIDCDGISLFAADGMFSGLNNKIVLPPKIINNENTAISGEIIFSGGQFSEYEVLEFLQGFNYSTNSSGGGSSASSLGAIPYSLGISNNVLDLSEVNAKWHEIINNEKSYKKYSSNPSYSGMVSSCPDCIKSIRNIPIQYTDTTKRTSSIDITPRYRTLYCCDSFAFATDNGTPYAMNWKSIVLDIGSSDSYTFGYGTASYTNNFEYKARGFWKVVNNIFDSDSMTIDEAKARYDQLKSRDDWYSCGSNSVTYDGKSLRLAMLFSRYNHDSAVETINSLPDTSAYLATAGGTNTIKFKKYAGALTDGGAIGTLTEEEIAVAAAKGWTVSLV